MATKKKSAKQRGSSGQSSSAAPSYVGLLNAIAVVETEAERFLLGWANVTPDPITGGLLGRYIAEERDSGRILHQARKRARAAAKGRTVATK